MSVKAKMLLFYTSRTTEKTAKQKNAILVCKHFQTSNHNFRGDAKLTPIEKIMKSATAKQYDVFEKKKCFWIIKLKKLHPDGLNQECNDV